MRLSTFVILVFISISSFGQDTTFYDFKWNKIPSIIGARYLEIILKDSADTSKTIVRKYVRPKTLLEETPYADFENKIIDGTYRKFYESGYLHIQIPYKKGIIDGDLVTYWGDGELKRTDKYVNGKFISGRILNTNGRELPYYDYVLQPRFKKGEKKMAEYFQKSIQYPTAAKEKKISGTVEVKFTVSEKGVINNPVVVKSIDSALDKEAIRVIYNMPRWIPGMIDGMPVECEVTLPVTFSL